MSEPEFHSNSATGSVTYPFWLRAAAGFGLLGALVACLSRVRTIDPDLFHELALIRELLISGRIPVADCFAYTPTLAPVVHHEWGTGLILYLATVSSHLGGAGLMLVEYCLALFIAIGSYACARRRGASLPVYSVLAPLGLIMAWIGFSTVRAQLFTLAFVVALQLLLTVDEKQRRWWLPVWLVAYVVWLNLHAGFLVGCGLFVISASERLVRETLARRSLRSGLRQVRYLFACVGLMIFLIAINPYGIEYYRYLWRAVPLPRTAITEWRPLWRINAWELLWALIFSQLINLYAIRAKGIRGVLGIATVAVPALLAFQHARHLSIYAVVWMCYAPAWIEHTAMGQKIVRLWSTRARLVCAFWLILGTLGIIEGCRSRFWEPLLPTSPIETPYAVPIYPAGAVRYLAEHRFRGNVHTPFVVGAYVSWKLAPDVKVSTDGRYEVAYPPGQVEQLEDIFRMSPGWEATLDRFRDTDAILVPWWSDLGQSLTENSPRESSPRQNSPGGDSLNPDSRATADSTTGATRWQRIYQDDAFSIYIRHELAARFPVVDRRGTSPRGEFP